MSDTKLKFPFGEIFEMAGNQHLAPSPKKNIVVDVAPGLQPGKPATS
jgi:hypothetical protein